MAVSRRSRHFYRSPGQRRGGPTRRRQRGCRAARMLTPPARISRSQPGTAGPIIRALPGVVSHLRPACLPSSPNKRIASRCRPFGSRPGVLPGYALPPRSSASACDFPTAWASRPGSTRTRSAGRPGVPGVRIHRGRHGHPARPTRSTAAAFVPTARRDGSDQPAGVSKRWRRGGRRALAPPQISRRRRRQHR